jgi:hypothetical protein
MGQPLPALSPRLCSPWANPHQPQIQPWAVASVTFSSSCPQPQPKQPQRRLNARVALATVADCTERRVGLWSVDRLTLGECPEYPTNSRRVRLPPSRPSPRIFPVTSNYLLCQSTGLLSTRSCSDPTFPPNVEPDSPSRPEYVRRTPGRYSIGWTGPTDRCRGGTSRKRRWKGQVDGARRCVTPGRASQGQTWE